MRRSEGGEITHPLCLITVRVEERVLEAQVDAILGGPDTPAGGGTAGCNHRLTAAEERREPRSGRRRRDVGLRRRSRFATGTGCTTRDLNNSEIAQITEGDIVEMFPLSQRLCSGDEDMKVNVDIVADDAETLHELGAQDQRKTIEWQQAFVWFLIVPLPNKCDFGSFLLLLGGNLSSRASTPRGNQTKGPALASEVHSRLKSCTGHCFAHPARALVESPGVFRKSGKWPSKLRSPKAPK
ncbi:hypothetical protein B0H15DRAFT_980140 [Mycena belliarum]|uniref:Uncharacterized protein n=1 Tax=Mycena belliarum TaxID=1033014 RepID=A0AAD6U3R9_9AGAR|nr:hypothetical protein B0H15DRAFT_980140 [Mycena belliae]